VVIKIYRMYVIKRFGKTKSFRKRMLHNENYSKNGIYVKRQGECEIERIESYSFRVPYMLILSGAE
jgi:hypothetical protein